MNKDIRAAMLGDHEAAKRLTEAGVLVPCTCGAKATLEHDCLIEHIGWGKSFLVYWVRCHDCGTETKHYREDSEGAIREWNTRAPILSAEEMEMLEGME